MRLAIWSLWGLLAVCAWAQTPAGVTHGPILGRLGERHVGVWARLGQPGSFHVRFGLSPGAMDRMSATTRVTAEHDYTGWVLVDGLRPNTKYFYQVVVTGQEEGAAAPDGSFTTLPAAEAFRHPEHNPRGLFNFRFEYACGNNQAGRPGDPSMPTYGTMLERLKDKVHFAILNGDWLYEVERDYPVEKWLRQVRLAPEQTPRIVRLAPSITGVWENYKAYLSRGRALSAWHRNVPSYFTFDDHEILNDVYGAGTAGRRDRKAVLRDIAVRAWYDYLGWSNPVPFQQGIHFGQGQLEAGSDVLVDPEADFRRLNLSQAANLHIHWGGRLAAVLQGNAGPGNPNAGVYDVVEVLDQHRLRIRPAARATGAASYSIGRLSHYDFRIANTHFFVLDTRTFREMHDSRQPDKPGLSMLGRQQKSWLMEGMKNSDADFFFVVSSVNFMIPHVGGTPGGPGSVRRIENKDDAWTVFLDEREQLIRFWDSLGKPVMVLTGDLHNSFAIQITDRVWEFASGPHTSGNHVAASEGDRPANGTYDSMGRKCEIMWSSYFLSDVPGRLARLPIYTVVQVNNVFNNPVREGEARWVAYPAPQVVVQYYDARNGDLLFAQPVRATR